MILRYFPAHMSNKGNPDKFRVDLFIMVDSNIYFYNLDV